MRLREEVEKVIDEKIERVNQALLKEGFEQIDQEQIKEWTQKRMKMRRLREKQGFREKRLFLGQSKNRKTWNLWMLRTLKQPFERCSVNTI